MDERPLYHAILKALPLCHEGVAEGKLCHDPSWESTFSRIIEILHEGLCKAKCDVLPVVPMRDLELSGFPPGTRLPGVAFRPHEMEQHYYPVLSRSDGAIEHCRKQYEDRPVHVVNYEEGQRPTLVASLVGKVVPVVIEVIGTYQPSQHDPPATGAFMYQGTLVDAPGDYGGVHPDIQHGRSPWPPAYPAPS